MTIRKWLPDMPTNARLIFTAESLSFNPTTRKNNATDVLLDVLVKDNRVRFQIGFANRERKPTSYFSESSVGSGELRSMLCLSSAHTLVDTIHSLQAFLAADWKQAATLDRKEFETALSAAVANTIVESFGGSRIHIQGWDGIAAPPDLKVCFQLIEGVGRPSEKLFHFLVPHEQATRFFEDRRHVPA